MSAINVDVQDGLTGALDKGLAATQPAAPPRAGSAATVSGGTYLRPPAGVTPDPKFEARDRRTAGRPGGGADPEEQSVRSTRCGSRTGRQGRFASTRASAIPRCSLANGYDQSHPEDRGGISVFASSEGGLPAANQPNPWIQPGTPGLSADGPFWTDPYPLIEDAELGVSAWYQGSVVDSGGGGCLADEARSSRRSARRPAPSTR